MPQYKTVSGVFFPSGGAGGEDLTVPAGKVITLEEERAKDYLERGSIKPYDESASDEPENKEVAGVTEQEFGLNGNEYKLIRNSEGLHYVLNGQKVSEDAFTSAKQAHVQEEESARSTEKKPEQPEVQTSQEPPLDPQNPQLDTQEQVTQQHQLNNQVQLDPVTPNSPVLTPEQLQNDFAQTQSQPSNGQPQ